MLTVDKRLVKEFGFPLGKKIRQRLNELRSATTLTIISKLPGAHLHPLSGDRAGQWAVKLTGKDRFCLIIDHDPIPLMEDGGLDMDAVSAVCIVEVVNYH